MKKFLVEIPIHGTETYYVEAESEEEALQKIQYGEEDIKPYETEYDWDYSAAFCEER